MDPAVAVPGFGRDGAQLFAGVASALLPELHELARGLPAGRAGLRLHGEPALAELLAGGGVISELAVAVCGRAVRPVRALFFDKTAETNWSLGWHQDRTICVRDKVEQPGFGPWTVKQGLHHVAPPMGLLDRMVTLRIHLDDVLEDNAPLLVALGSHKLGFIEEGNIDAVVAQSAVHSCTALAGDIWAYATPILHASEIARVGEHRRVLQVDFSADELPGELNWRGV